MLDHHIWPWGKDSSYKMNFLTYSYSVKLHTPAVLPGTGTAAGSRPAPHRVTGGTVKGQARERGAADRVGAHPRARRDASTGATVTRKLASPSWFTAELPIHFFIANSRCTFGC